MARNKNVLIAVDESFKYWLKEHATKERMSMIDFSKKIAEDKESLNIDFKLNFAKIPGKNEKRKTFW